MELELALKLMEIFEEGELKKLVFKKGDFELHLEKESSSSQCLSQTPKMVMAENATESAFQMELSQMGGRGGHVTRKPEVEGRYVASPMVGTYYAAPGPGQSPFVKIGDEVDENTVVCIIEAMKVMNEVKAGTAGKIADILVNQAEPVEFGTKLLRIV